LLGERREGMSDKKEWWGRKGTDRRREGTGDTKGQRGEGDNGKREGRCSPSEKWSADHFWLPKVVRQDHF